MISNVILIRYLGLAVDTDRGLMVPVGEMQMICHLLTCQTVLKKLQCMQKCNVNPDILSSEAGTLQCQTWKLRVEIVYTVINLLSHKLGVNTIIPRPKDLGVRSLCIVLTLD